jgi:VWFA-related protein
MRCQFRSVTVWLCAFALAAQTPAPAPKAPATAPSPAPSAAAPSPSQPTIRVTTHLVQINVIVQDKKGQPVTDLTKDDFIVLDKGQEQKVSTFSMESSIPAGGVPVAPPVKRAPLPPNIFTNKMDRRMDAPKSVTIILFDGLNTKFEDQSYARQQVIKYLQQVGPEDRVALYALGLNLTILHDFTSETSRLLAALAKYKGRYSPELDAANPDPSDTGDDDLDAWLDHANQMMADYYQINKVNQTCEALEAIANHVAKVPGRKNLIWVSSGFPIYIGFDEAVDNQNPSSKTGGMDTSDKRVFNEEMERAARALNQASIAIYPVDARGLATSPSFQATTKQSYNARRPNANTGMPQSFYRTQDTMKILAESTGGKAYTDSNDLKNAIRHAIDDGRVSYVIGYYPTYKEWNGEYHEIKVQVKRPHLSVRYRLGYYAYPDRSQDDKERMAVLRDAVWSPLEAISINLSARVDPSDDPKPGSVKVYLQVDPRDITLQLQDGRWMGGLDLFFVQQNQEGQSTASPLMDSLKLQLPPESRDKAFKTGLIVAKAIPIEAASTKLRVVVRDRPSGLVGSLNINLAKVLKKP